MRKTNGKMKKSVLIVLTIATIIILAQSVFAITGIPGRDYTPGNYSLNNSSTNTLWFYKGGINLTRGTIDCKLHVKYQRLNDGTMNLKYAFTEADAFVPASVTGIQRGLPSYIKVTDKTGKITTISLNKCPAITSSKYFGAYDKNLNTHFTNSQLPITITTGYYISCVGGVNDKWNGGGSATCSIKIF